MRIKAIVPKPIIFKHYKKKMETIKCITFDKKAQNSLPEHIKAKMKADREKTTNHEIPCGICENTHVRTAITYHGIKVCHSCMEFLKKQSELNGRTWEEEISYQTKRLS